MRRTSRIDVVLLLLLAGGLGYLAAPAKAQTLVAVGVLGFLLCLLEYWRRQRAGYRRAVREFRWDPGMSPLAFEHHCADYLEHLGWDARTTKSTGDQGIDVIAEKRGMRLVIQCKKQRQPVGNRAVQQAYAGRAFARADHAAVVSNSSYTPAARELALRTGVLLLHFTELEHADRLFGH